ncbi:MAG: zinc ribbon domain-containing protein [Chloroflexi bacterium]|nr:zinc ribbon domain-containing protein [Chloroflexota bacterium]
MPLYEYYCENCDKVFDSLQAISRSDQPVACPDCGRDADRIMPTTFATMSRQKGLKERVPYHHHDVREGVKKPPIARVKPKSAPKRSASGKAKGQTQKG